MKRRGQLLRHGSGPFAAGACIVLGMFAAPATATEAHWALPVSGQWTLGTNWSTSPAYPNNGSPAAADTYNAVVDAAGAKYTVTLNGDVAVNELRVASADATVALTGGTVLTLQSGIAVTQGAVTVANATVRGGSLSATSPSQIQFGFLSTLDGLTLPSGVTALGGATVKNGLTFDGGKLVVLAPAQQIMAAGSQTWSGVGEVAFSGPGGFSNASLVTPDPSSTLTIDPGLAVRAVGCYGAIGGTVVASSMVKNRGTISAGAFGGIVLRSGFLNSGTVEARDGGIVTATTSTPTVANLVAGVLTGGTWAVYAGSTFDPFHGVNVVTNDADVILSGVGSVFNSIKAIQTNAGTFTVKDGRDFTTAGALTNSGTLTVGAGSTLTVTGALTSDGGSIGGDGAVVMGGANLSGKVVMPGTGMLRVNGALSLADGAGLDVARGQIVLYYAGASPLGQVAGWVRSAYDPGALEHWHGPGIGSSTAAADRSLAIGWAEAADVLGLNPGGTGIWHGQAVDATSVLVALALTGDADLNAAVEMDDLIRLSKNYGGAGDWADGEFTNDGIVDFEDLRAWARNYTGPVPVGGVPGAPAGFDRDVAAALAAVPEPGGLVTGALVSGVALLRRRRRR